MRNTRSVKVEVRLQKRMGLLLWKCINMVMLYKNYGHVVQKAYFVVCIASRFPCNETASI